MKAPRSSLQAPVRLPDGSPSLTQDQRLAWLNELLTGSSESLQYRVAGTLLLLYAQPLVRVAALPTSAVTVADRAVTITLAKHAAPVPDPFAGLLREHLARRPNLRTGSTTSPWLFPGTRAGSLWSVIRRFRTRVKVPGRGRRCGVGCCLCGAVPSCAW